MRRLLRSFIVLPGLFAAGGIAAAFVCTHFDRSALAAQAWLLPALPTVGEEAARAILGTIAGSTITVLSLVYSMTLVVFTLAAGTLGPRLVERFLEDKNSQIAAGVLAATFSFALVAMVRVDGQGAARLSVLGALLLALASLATLLLFVRTISRRVTLDGEITRIGLSLAIRAREIAEQHQAYAATDRVTAAAAIDWSAGRPLPSPASGYFCTVDVPELVAVAASHDARLWLRARPGDPVLEGVPIAILVGGDSATAEAVQARLAVTDQRAEADDGTFDVNLLLEIALRALSPGVNDSYTALAVIDQLGRTLLPLLQAPPAASLHRDDQGIPRLRHQAFDAADAVGLAFPTLRRAAAGNVLVTLRLALTLGMLAGRAHPAHGAALLDQLRTIRSELDSAGLTPADRATVSQACDRAMATCGAS